MDEELQEMIAGFVEDCREGFESMEEDLMAMEEDPESKETMNNLFRVMHTLKGTAGFMGLNEIQSFAHKMESVFDLVRQEKLTLTPKLLDFLLPGIDKLKAMVFGQIGECEIPDATDDIETLEKIIETCSDAILSGEAASPPVEEVPVEAELVEEAPVEAEPVEEAPAEVSDDDIDFDAILQEYGENVPSPEAPAEPVETAVDSAFQEALEQVDVEIPASPTGLPEGTSSELLQQFVIEAEEHLVTIEESLLVLEGDQADKETINTFFRAIHSIKGTAGYVNLKQIEMLSHRIETIFDLIRKEEMEYSKEIGDIVFKSIDSLRTMVFFIKNEDFSQQVDITNQIKYLVAIASLKRTEIASPAAALAEEVPAAETPPASPTAELPAVDADQLNTFLTGAQQQLEVLDIYQVELQKGPLDEHDLITLHRSLKTLHAGAKYCNLVVLEAAIDDYEELLLKVLGGEIEQTKLVITGTLQPSHQRVIDAIHQLKTADLSTLSKPVEAEKPKEPPPLPKPVEAEKPKEPPPPPKPVEAEKPKEPPPPPAVPAVSQTEIAQQRAARKITNKPEEEKAVAAANTSEAKTMRVDASRLDRFMNLIGELIITRNAFKHLADTMDEGRTVIEIIQDIKQIENSISRISDNLQDNLMEMRLVQVKTVFQRMPRIVRDIARKTNKKITMQMIGETTEVDKSIVEEIGDPLVHIVRNSCDHGIETPEDRIAVGKPEQGTITLKAMHMGSFIAIDIIDDGGGIDPIKIKKLAVKKDVISQDESDNMGDDEAVNLIFAPGFSTAEQVSDISGRGVGMDVVMTNIRNIQGSVDVTSKLGEGTQVRLKLPLTLAVIEALIVGVNGTSYAIPLDAIKETVQVKQNAIKNLKDKSALELRGDILGITPLTELLHLNASEEDEEDINKELSIVVLNVGGREIGISVDRLFNQQEVVVKPLEDYLSSIPGLKGSTIMGDGQVVLILEPNELMELATSNL